jgi:hypothetical protein
VRKVCSAGRGPASREAFANLAENGPAHRLESSAASPSSGSTLPAVASSEAKTVAAYLKELPVGRRKLVSSLRKLVREHLAKGFVEQMQYGMISWVVPLSRYPKTYNGQPLAVACLASQKQYVSLYLFCAYADPKERKRFERAYVRSGKRLDMGKSCVRIAKLEDLAVDAVADALSRASVEGFTARYERSRK